MRKGRFIVIEGGEGSGKTTMLKLAREMLAHRDNVVFSREPGGTEYAEMIRNTIMHPHGKKADAYTLFGLFWAARADHMNHLIIPTLQKGGVVVLDRFDSSSYAYQIHAQKNRQLEDVFWHVREIFLKKWVPDIYIYLDLDPRIGIQRKMGQVGEMNHFEEQAIDYHNRVRRGYKSFLKAVPHKIIDASKPLDRVKGEFKTVFSELIS